MSNVKRVAASSSSGCNAEWQSREEAAFVEGQRAIRYTVGEQAAKQ